jgi:hypothetical protein
MKKLMLLIPILLVSLCGFSQTDTKSDSIVQLKVPIAKLVIKDILSGDGAKAELKEVYKVLDEKNLQIGLYKQKDSLKDEKITNLNVIIDKKDQQFALEREKSNSLLKELKVQKFKTAVYKAGSGIALIMTVLFLVK